MPLIQNSGPGTLAGDLAEISGDTFAELSKKYPTKFIPEKATHAVVVPDAIYRDHKGKRVYLGDGDVEPTPEQSEAVGGLAAAAEQEYRAGNTRSLHDARRGVRRA